jgi:hypothetical protein
VKGNIIGGERGRRGEEIPSCRILVVKAEGKRPPGKYNRRWNTIEMCLKNGMTERGLD